MLRFEYHTDSKFGFGRSPQGFEPTFWLNIWRFTFYFDPFYHA